MRNVFYSIILATLFSACVGASSKQTKMQTQEEKITNRTIPIHCTSCSDDCALAGANKVNKSDTLTIEQVLLNGEDLIDQVIFVRGTVSHTCKHSGKRCFIIGEDQQTSLRIEAKGNINSFNKELVGNEIIIKGIVKANKITKEYIDQYSKVVKEKELDAKESDEMSACASEQENIKKMREWMKKNGKDYYITYAIDGQEFSIIK